PSPAVGPPRPPHAPHRPHLPPARQLVARVAPPPVQGRPPAAQHVLVDARRLTRDVLEDEDVHDQCAGGPQPSSTDGCQSAPTVREFATHEPSSGCGNFACFSFNWMPYELPLCRCLTSTFRAISSPRPSGIGK